MQTKFWCKSRANLLKNISKNSEKNYECASQLTSHIYKISWSNSSYPKSYKKDKMAVFSHGEKTDEVVLDQSTKHIQSAKFHS